MLNLWHRRVPLGYGLVVSPPAPPSLSCAQGECDSSIGLTLNDWVRRLDLRWPYAAVGTASGAVHVVNLSSNTILASAERAHPAYVPDNGDALQLLHGSHDGGGITAIAFDGLYVVSGGRDCNAKVWRFPVRYRAGCPHVSPICGPSLPSAYFLAFVVVCAHVPLSLYLSRDLSRDLSPCFVWSSKLFADFP